MKIAEIIAKLESIAPAFLQEDYDNAGLITGNPADECKGILVSLDATEAVIQEAIDKKCNLVVAHHPIVFRGLKKINGKHYVERAIIKAIKNDIALFAIHTNLDNILTGVNGKIADKIGLINRTILAPKQNLLQKLAVFVPQSHHQILMEALFAAGAGGIGEYSECSFSTEGTGTFKAGAGTNPFVGQIGQRHTENEKKVEVIFPVWLRNKILQAMRAAHPYEEIAYDLYNLANTYQETGSGIIGKLSKPMEESEFLNHIKKEFNLKLIRHTPFLGNKIEKVAVCGGAGSFLTQAAIASGADAYITADVKYHEFFEADNRLLLADIGHYESEQFTIDLLADVLSEKFPNFAVLKTGVQTNPVHYFTS